MLLTKSLVLTVWLSFSICAFGQATEDNTEDSQTTDTAAAQKGEQSEAEKAAPVKRRLFKRKTKSDEDYFSVKVRPADDEEDLLLLQLTLNGRPQDDQWIGETIVYWVGPEGEGFSIPIRPVTQSALAAQVYGPFAQGQHKLLVSLAVRGSDRFVETFYEQELILEIPSLKLSSTPMRRLPSLSGSEGAGNPIDQSGASGWLTALKWLGLVTAAALAIALLGLGGLILRRRGILTLRVGPLSEKLTAPFLAKLAAIRARRKPGKASDESAPSDSAAEDRTIIAEESGDPSEGATVIEAVKPTENPAPDPPSEPKAEESSVPSGTASKAESAQPDDLQEQAF